MGHDRERRRNEEQQHVGQKPLGAAPHAHDAQTPAGEKRKDDQQADDAARHRQISKASDGLAH